MTIIRKDKDMELLKSYRKQVMSVKHYYKYNNILNSYQIKELDYYINNILRYCKKPKNFKKIEKQKLKRDDYWRKRHMKRVNLEQLEHYKMLAQMLGHIRKCIYRENSFNNAEYKTGLYNLFIAIIRHISAHKKDIETRLKSGSKSKLKQYI